MWVTLDHLPGVRGKNKKGLKPPTKIIVIFKCIPGPKIDVSTSFGQHLWFMRWSTNYPRDQKGTNNKLKHQIDEIFVLISPFWTTKNLEP